MLSDCVRFALRPLLAVGDAHDQTMLITMVTAISAGVILIAVARRLNLPSIVVLLAGGILLGPELWGERALVQPDALGDGLLVVVHIAVGLILFEGGLTLDLSDFRSAPSMIKRLLTIGIAITWLATATAVSLVLGHSFLYALVAASLVIVTGPTVIAPLLRRIRVNARLNSILHWEGVIIDPIGVFIAVLCFEWVISGESGGVALGHLAQRVVAGGGYGVLGGLLLAFLVRRKVVPEDMVNVFSLAWAVVIFGLAEAVQPEAGLLSVTIAGFVFGLSGSYKLKKIREFKAELTDLLIGTLFILLAARLSLEQFADFGPSGFVVVAIVMFVVRPLSVVVCAWGSDLSGREKLFLSWVAPRGIVAASMASLFAISMEGLDTVSDPKFVETFTYSVIVSTIVLQGLTAGPLARLLGLRRDDPTGWLIVGAHALGRRIARFISETAGSEVILIDSNARAVQDARAEGLYAMSADARDAELRERYELQVVGNLLALTDNEDLNIRLCQIWSEVVGPDNVFRCNPGGSASKPEEEGEALGTLVWPSLPKPSLIAGELGRGEAIVLEADAHTPALSRLASPLASVIDGSITFDLPPEPGAGQPARTLYLQRQADYLVRSLHPDLMMTLEPMDLPSLLEAMVDRVVTIEPSLPRDQTVSGLLACESSFPSAIGHGVVVPHIYTAELPARVCAVARIPGGLDISTPDGVPVRLAFLLLSPQGDPEGHLETLAEIARLVVDAKVREMLMAAEPPAQMLRVVRTSHRG